ncbi:Transmembrane protein 8A [Nibea albiflora]|uniref:Transmembrane protein 8A n=1 Tax=Nibea albiflora TaxID=240163 RepID=A0ACB7FHQ7_NIBAL|nr:Transmembrane protein 8A [Nibea albiflora]
MASSFLRALLFVVLTARTSGDDGQVTFVSELSSKPAQKLSKYGWYGNVRLQRFHVPEETAVARWLFSVTKGHNFNCGQHNVTIHIRWGAPPVINPIGSTFPNSTLWSPCLSLILPVTSHSSTTFNLSDPAPGDWYVAAHLPEDDGRIEQKHGPVAVNCSGTGCSAALSNPPWDSWLRVVVESNHDNRTVTFSIVSNYTVGCKPKSVGLRADDDMNKLRGNSSYINSTSAGNSSVVADTVASSNESASPLTPLLASACVWSIPVLHEEVDVLSVRFTPVNGPNVSVTDTHPTLLTYPLPTQATALFGGYGVHVNASVPKAVVRLPFPHSTTWYLALQLTCNSSSDCGNTSLVSVVPEVFVSACVEDCGTYGECRLLRSYSYLYAACVCKAGWNGWGCTDDSTAQSYRRQLTATLLLTLSNLSFLPAIVVAIKRCYITEASVYLFTMFFSTFYHACDQPGVAVMCIMEYDALQYCDFLGSICSIWVTILCMARIRDTFKYTLFMFGALLIAMSMQLDRKGLWNLLGPVLCAILIMVSAWVYRGVRRRHCYPPSWKRWVLYLIPGALCALIGVCLYIFAETEGNYYYTHSLWHILVASCVVFLLPPKEKERETVGWSRGWSWSWRPRVCGYTLCQSSKDELYTVT